MLGALLGTEHDLVVGDLWPDHHPARTRDVRRVVLLILALLVAVELGGDGQGWRRVPRWLGALVEATGGIIGSQADRILVGGLPVHIGLLRDFGTVHIVGIGKVRERFTWCLGREGILGLIHLVLLYNNVLLDEHLAERFWSSRVLKLLLLAIGA